MFNVRRAEGDRCRVGQVVDHAQHIPHLAFGDVGGCCVRGDRGGEHGGEACQPRVLALGQFFPAGDEGGDFGLDRIGGMDAEVKQRLGQAVG